MSLKTEIYVPTLMDGNRIVVPQFWLGSDIEYRKDRKDNSLSAAEYNSQMQLSTLAELRHAFFTNNDYRQSARSRKGRGEWTSTFLQDGKRAIEMPENVVYRNGVWVVEGGKTILVELPPNGWTLEYDKPTGFPSRTSQNKKDAEKVFGDNASIYHSNSNGLMVVSRLFDVYGSGPFFVLANCKPDAVNSYVGGRACRRS